MKFKNTLRIIVLLCSVFASSNSHAVLALEPSQWVNIAQNTLSQIKEAAILAKQEILAAAAVITESNTYITAVETAQTAIEAANTVARLKTHYDAITGSYSFGAVMNAANDRSLRRYMPEDYNSTVDAINNSSLPSDMAALEGAVNAYQTENALYATAVLFDDPNSYAAQHYNRQYTDNMTMTSLARSSLSQTNLRYQEIEFLIDQIDVAEDPKAAWDLGNRINAQKALLTNEEIRLQALAIRQKALEDERRLKERADLIRVVTAETDWEAN